MISGYSARGKEKVEVAEELLERAMEMGFLKDGGTVSFAIDAPDEDIFQEYGVELRTEITDYLEGRVLASVEVVNYRESPPEDAYEPAAASAESRALETPAPPEETAPAASVPTEETAPAASVPPAQTAPAAPTPPAETAPPATVPPRRQRRLRQCRRQRQRRRRHLRRIRIMTTGRKPTRIIRMEIRTTAPSMRGIRIMTIKKIG